MTVENTALLQRINCCGINGMRNLIRNVLGQPTRRIEVAHGKVDFDFSGTKVLLDLPLQHPEILHCHNLHGNYFYLRKFSWIREHVFIIFNLQDAWLFLGHCARLFHYGRWKTGRGRYPDLSIYSRILRDVTSFKRQCKKEIYSRSRFFIATLSQWVMDRVDHSILAPSIIDKRIIPNGIDRTIFRQGDIFETWSELRLPANAQIVLFATNGIRKNVYKNYRTMHSAIDIATKNMQNSQLLFFALGENTPAEPIGAAVIHIMPHKRNISIVTRHFQAVDSSIHAAHAETFSNTVAEARGCETPVITTAVGGIPEYLHDREMGFLTPPGDALAMAAAIQRLLEDPDLKDKMGKSGIEDVRSWFSLEFQIDRSLRRYKDILDNYDYLYCTSMHKDHWRFV